MLPSVLATNCAVDEYLAGTSGQDSVEGVMVTPSTFETLPTSSAKAVAVSPDSLQAVVGVYHYKVYLLDLNNFDVEVLAGSGVSGVVDGIGESARFSAINSLAWSPQGNKIYVADSNYIREIDMGSKAVNSIHTSGYASIARLQVTQDGYILFSFGHYNNYGFQELSLIHI